MSDGLPQPRRSLAFLAVAIAVTMAVLDGAIVNVALPSIARDVGVDPAGAVWVVNAYQLVVTMSLLPLSSLGDILGHRRVYCAGLALFTAASGLCALSDTFAALVAARALQGFGAAGIMSVNIALVRFIYPAAQIGRGVGNTALVVGMSSAAGPSIAAVILAAGPWQWLFLVNLPLGLLALAVAFATLPETPRSGLRFDLEGALLSAATFGLLILGIDMVSRVGGRLAPALLIAGAAGLGCLFAYRQLGRASPMLPVDLLRRPAFALSVMTSICSFSAQMLVFISLPFWLQDGQGLSAEATGVLMTPWPLATALMAPLAGRLADHLAPGRLGAAGLLVMATGLMLLAALGPRPGSFDIAWRLAVCGFGFGLFQSPNNRMIIMSAPPQRSGGASGMQSTARLLGQSIGAALAAIIFSLAGATEQGRFALSLAALLAAAGALASVLRRGPARPEKLL
jgi:DHA2 family multidrug resistance protein-like MFS transporter